MLTTDQLDQVSRVVEAAISKARNSTPAEPADNAIRNWKQERTQFGNTIAIK